MKVDVAQRELVLLLLLSLLSLLTFTVDEVKVDIAHREPGSKAIKVRSQHLWKGENDFITNLAFKFVAQKA